MFNIAINLEYLVRILIASACGALIGYERTSRLKTAGIRTHVIVSLAASLMMVISKYGFNDILQNSNIGLDPSRIAAGVVTAIGFLGAGIIFIHNQNVSGLTTAAGIWATVGVGMTIGCGLYFLGILTTLLLIIIQFLLHKDFKWNKSPVIETITFQIDTNSDVTSLLKETLGKKSVEVTNIVVKRTKQQTVKIRVYLKLPDNYDIYDVIQILIDNPAIESIEI